MKLPIANKLFILEELLERYHFSFFSSQEQERETIDDETKSILKKSA